MLHLQVRCFTTVGNLYTITNDRRSRRIKCDETRPTCLRCERSKRLCFGYRDQTPEDDAEIETVNTEATWQASLPARLLATHPTAALSRFSDNDRLRHRFAALACTALQSGEAKRSGSCASVWAIIVPKLNQSVPVVSFALAALGSALEADILFRSTRASTDTTMAKQYGAAIREIQKEVAQPVHPPECLLLSCLILACAEVLQWREVSAMVHVQGAFTLLRDRWTSNSTVEVARCDGRPEDTKLSDGSDVFTPKDELDFLFVRLDLLTASYALGLPPRLPHLDLQLLFDIPPNERHQSNLELEVIHTVHSCYHVAYLISEYKYLGLRYLPLELAFQQARHIAQLFARLGDVERQLRSQNGSKVCTEGFRPTPRVALILRSQCLASLIYLSMISNGHECGYDAYASYFQQIIADADTLLGSEAMHNEVYANFSTGLGILQPLLLAATKYRDPVLRRRAIALLKKGGREGPFHGPTLSAIASRAVEVEEASLEAQGLQATAATDISESVRLHGTGIYLEGMAGSDNAKVEVTLSRCHDVDGIQHSTKRWDDPEHWDIWTETVFLEQ